MRLLLAFVGTLACLPAQAAAEAAVVLVVHDETSLAELDRARSAAIEVLAERGVRLVRTPNDAACEDSGCAVEIAERSGADLVVLVRLERGDESGRVRVQLVSASGPPREATARVGDAGAGAATAAALEEALAASREHRSGFLLVRTRPGGARVSIDGRPSGDTPLRRMVRAGEHHVRIAPSDGGSVVERTVEVRPLEETAIDLRLDSGDGDEVATAPEEAAPTRTRPSPFNWVIGGGLAVAGVVALVSPLQTLATEGQCVDLIEDVGCMERVQFGAQSGVLMGVGLAALAAAVVVDVSAPIRVAVTAAPERAELRVEGRF